ncbi:MAG: glycosyl hydrolase [Anaerolineaceae bacterium]|nr:glycosyl hydrolase [Anaerolineaceae bacterium]
MKNILFSSLQKFLQKKFIYFLLLFVFFNSCSAAPLPKTPVPQEAERKVFSTTTQLDPTPTVYLPLIVNTQTSKFFGIYLKQYWTEDNVTPIMSELDNQTGKKHSSVGWFIDIEDDAFTIPVETLPNNNLFLQLESLWQDGYVSFINLGSRSTIAEITNGTRDKEIGNVARFYKAWIDQGEGRKALIAPLQEMNGVFNSNGDTWTTYAGDPVKFIQAYKKIQEIFFQNGVNLSDVWWTFAPNGWSVAGHEFEKYYPGDDIVDVIGFSSYNYGYCFQGSTWETYKEMLEPYINRMETMAPGKPIIIAETATTSMFANSTPNDNAKDQWLIDTYNYLAEKQSVVGVYYFSFSEFDDKACDFEIINIIPLEEEEPGIITGYNFDNFFTGYRAGISNSKYQYLSAQEVNSLLH